MTSTGKLRFGTSSWSESSWVGSFYPRGTKPAEFLTHYATQFDTVEADVTYYRVPDEAMVRGWDERTPDGFVLSAKFPRSIVHCGEGPRPDPKKLLLPEFVQEDLDQFLGSMALLGNKCGPLVLQFPYFNKQVFPRREDFLERLDSFLDRLPRNCRYAVEVRNKWWIREELLEVLRRHRVALVLVDISYLPHPAATGDRLDMMTTDFAYVRLIGDRAALERMTDRFDQVVVDQTGRLRRWVPYLRRVLEQVPITWLYSNNHYAGHAPATVRTLVEMVT